MAWEQSKAAKRRYDIGAFHSRYFRGHGVDIGGKPDPLGQYVGIFPQMQSVKTWDLEDGDAQFMLGVDDNAFDFVHSSHCLEHMHDPYAALDNWIRITKPGGHLIITVPDEDMYERGIWPSESNPDHKHTFSMYRKDSWSPVSINVIDLTRKFARKGLVEIEKIETIRDFFRQYMFEQGLDQTLTPVCECAIEFILRKN